MSDMDKRMAIAEEKLKTLEDYRHDVEARLRRIEHVLYGGFGVVLVVEFFLKFSH
jgi:hypothetical protein